MSTPLLPNALWNLIQPLLPSSPRRPKGGRPRLPDRACLTGILFAGIDFRRGGQRDWYWWNGLTPDVYPIVLRDESWRKSMPWTGNFPDELMNC